MTRRDASETDQLEPAAPELLRWLAGLPRVRWRDIGDGEFVAWTGFTDVGAIEQGRSQPQQELS